MSIRKDVTVKITNNNATLDMPLQIYELDHGIELRFKLMDYKYKYTKDPQNILNSSDEDILEAYTTIINPRGYELQQINGEVKDDIVIFMIDSSYTDEIDEIGTYSLQIHIKCACSEFSIPPIQFEVLQRLKGIKVVTDGEDSIDDSALIDNYSNFISDETGKLLIEWKKGDIISSVKLNAMVEVINNAVDEEVQRQLNEAKREQQELERQNSVREALNSVDARVDEAMIEYETRFNALTASQQQDMEVIDARDGEVSLKARLDRDLRNPLQVYEDVEGSYISCDSVEGYAQNVEILGNTIQNQNDLADICSVGDKLENQELYEIPVLSANKNLFSYDFYDYSSYSQLDNVYVLKEIKLPAGIITISNKKIKEQTSDMGTLIMHFWDNTTYSTSTRKPMINGGWAASSQNIITIEEGKKYYIAINITGNTLSKETILEKVKDMYEIQIEVGDTATPYEPYQEDKLTILSPVQLEKVGDVADRIICKDGAWGVEKNVETVTFNGSEDWQYNANGDDNLTNTIRLNTKLKTTGIETASIMKNFKFLAKTNVDEEGHAIKNTGTNVFIRINKTRLSTADAEGFKLYLKSNPVTIYYQTTQPTFIPLPHDQQVKLRTFANKTNISFGCEIEPTLKASVPKSLSSTVSTHTEQIDNLGKEIDKIKKLEESVASEVITESDFITVAETSNGYFEDVKLDGKTLVNLCGDFTGKNSNAIDIKDNIVTFNELEGARFILYDASLLKPNTTYTLIMLGINIQTGIACDLYPDNFPELGKVSTDYPINVYKFTTPNDISSLNGIRYYVGNGVTAPSTLYSPIILEGDHTQNPPSYFEGLKSVGQDVDEISVLSCNENLFDNRLVEKGMYIRSDGDLVQGNETEGDRNATDYIRVNPSKEVYINGIDNSAINADKNVYFAEYDINKKVLKSNPLNVLSGKVKLNLLSDTKYIRFTVKDLDLNRCVVSYSDIYNYVTAKQDKKPLLYYNPTTDTWEKPILREWDSIEKHSDGKYYYHKRSGEVVLDGSEDWELRRDVTDDGVHSGFSFSTSFKYNKISSYMICDRFNAMPFVSASQAYSNGEGFGYYIGSDSKYILYCVLPKSKLSSQDAAGFKAWLQANPTTVVYELATEEVYECINIDLITYKNETNFIVNAGAIAPVSTLKVMCNINNVVRELQQKVSNLENYIQHVMIDALNNALNE